MGQGSTGKVHSGPKGEEGGLKNWLGMPTKECNHSTQTLKSCGDAKKASLNIALLTTGLCTTLVPSPAAAGKQLQEGPCATCLESRLSGQLLELILKQQGCFWFVGSSRPATNV